MSVLILAEKSYTADILCNALSDKRVKIVGLNGHVYTKDETGLRVSEKDLDGALKLETEEDAWLLGKENVESALLQIQNVLLNNTIHCIINACDDDKNGAYLFDYVYKQIELNVPVKRMHIKDLKNKSEIRNEYERCWKEFLDENIYLKIYVENESTLVLEGKGQDDVANVYYPTRWDDTAHRIGTVVIGRHHISITQEAIKAFTRIVDKAKHTGDDISCIDVHTCYGRKKDGSFTDSANEVSVSYIGETLTKFDVEKVIQDDNFFIGCGEGRPDTWLLSELVLV